MKFHIREKALFIPALVLVLVVAANALIASSRFRDAYAQALESRVRVLAVNLKLQIERLFHLGLALKDIEGYNDQCREVLAQHPDLSYAAITNRHGRILFHSDPNMVGSALPKDPTGTDGLSFDDGPDLAVHDVRVPIVDGSGVKQGYAVVGFPRALIDRRVNAVLARTSIVAGLSVLGALACLWAALSLLVVRPLSSLMSAIHAIGQEGTLERQVPVTSDDEIGQLGSTFNSLMRGIRARDGQIRRHIQQLQEARDQLELRVQERTAELTRANGSLRQEMERRQEAEKQRERMHTELVEVSRKAGMADMATGVLHNVGNVLNSVNVTATLLKDRLDCSRLTSLGKVVEVLKDRQGDLPNYLDQDPQGRQIVPFLTRLWEALETERQGLARETEGLIGNVNHVKEIVGAQQSMARVIGAVERFDMADAIEASLKINQAGLLRHGIEVERAFAHGAVVEADRHKVIQILVNLISNAKYAVTEADPKVRRLVIRMEPPRDQMAVVSVTDNGTGVAPENMAKLFTHGFTTRKSGHGFGLHASAVAAQEIGGRLHAHSDGPNKGATFTLEVPTSPPRRPQCQASSAQSAPGSS